MAIKKTVEVKSAPVAAAPVAAAPVVAAPVAAAPVVTAPEATAPAADAFALPKLDAATLEVPAAVRDIAEKGVEQTKMAYEKVKLSAGQAVDLIEETTATYSKGASELSGKLLANAQANTNAMFDFAQTVFGAKTLAEVVELQTAFVRKQFDALSAQGKDIQASVQKVATEVSAPVKAAAEKALAELKKSA